MNLLAKIEKQGKVMPAIVFFLGCKKFCYSSLCHYHRFAYIFMYVVHIFLQLLNKCIRGCLSRTSLMQIVKSRIVTARGKKTKDPP
jgi:hypothetical protein